MNYRDLVDVIETAEELIQEMKRIRDSLDRWSSERDLEAELEAYRNLIYRITAKLKKAIEMLRNDELAFCV